MYVVHRPLSVYRRPFREKERLLKTRALVAIFLTSVLQTGSAEAQVKVVYHEVAKEGQFFVLYSRAAGNATGAAIGGLIGASIQAGIENGKDEKKEKQVLEHLPSSECAPLFIESFLENLSASPDFSVAADQPEGDDYVQVELTIDRCGFKLVNSERMFVAPFAEARYRIYRASESKPKKASRLLLIGKVRSTWEDLLAQPADIALRFERTLQKAGKRLANKVIYSK